MRELKFRVFNPETGFFEYFELSNITVSDRLLSQHKYPVQQYVGLQDKKRFGIYEGDLVKYSLDGNDYEDEVVWENFGWVLRSLETDSSFPLNSGLELEVIGNIYQKTEKFKSKAP